MIQIGSIVVTKNGKPIDMRYGLVTGPFRVTRIHKDGKGRAVCSIASTKGRCRIQCVAVERLQVSQQEMEDEVIDWIQGV